jgi:hypothetical protein
MEPGICYDNFVAHFVLYAELRIRDEVEDQPSGSLADQP